MGEMEVGEGRGAEVLAVGGGGGEAGEIKYLITDGRALKVEERSVRPLPRPLRPEINTFKALYFAFSKTNSSQLWLSRPPKPLLSPEPSGPTHPSPSPSLPTRNSRFFPVTSFTPSKPNNIIILHHRYSLHSDCLFQLQLPPPSSKFCANFSC